MPCSLPPGPAPSPPPVVPTQVITVESPQNITLNPPEPIEMEISSTLALVEGPFGFGSWSVGGVVLHENIEGLFGERVMINSTSVSSKLVISPTNYGDSGVYVFEEIEADFDSAPINFYISLPPRPVESELPVMPLGYSCMYNHACLSATAHCCMYNTYTVDHVH